MARLTLEKMLEKKQAMLEQLRQEIDQLKQKKEGRVLDSKHPEIKALARAIRELEVKYGATQADVLAYLEAALDHQPAVKRVRVLRKLEEASA